MKHTWTNHESLLMKREHSLTSRASKIICTFRWGLVLLCLAPLSARAEDSPPLLETSRGATSAAESEILWKESSAHFKARRWREASVPLQRIVARYPAHPQSQQAKFFLARCWLELDEASRSVPLLKELIERNPPSLDPLEIRLLLGVAYLRVEKNNEATLVAEEVIHRTSSAQKKDTKAFAARKEAYLLKAEGLFARSSYARAQYAWDSARMMELSVEQDQLLLARMGVLDLKLTLKKCHQILLPFSDTEALYLDQMKRSLACVSQTQPSLAKLLESQSLPLLSSALSELEKHFLKLKNKALRPALPQGSKKWSAEQRKTYRLELISKTSELCRTFLEEHLTWFSTVPEVGADPRIARIQEYRTRVRGIRSEMDPAHSDISRGSQ